MALKSVQFIQTLLLSIIAGQAFFYLIGGTAGLRNVSASTFIEQRKAIDVVIGPYLKVLYPLSVVSSLAVVVLVRQRAESLLFVLSASAFLLIVLDLTIALKGNSPLNERMQSWSSAAPPADWVTVREQWLGYMYWRQACSITALLCVLTGVFSRP